MANMTVMEALEKAHQHWSAGQAQQAEHICRQILGAFPNQPDACHLMGIMSNAYGHKAAALDWMRKACAAPKATYHSNLAELCRQSGLLEEGIQHGQKAVQLDARMSGAWNNLGILLQESGRYAESRPCLEKALELDTDSPVILNNLGNTCLSLGIGEQAEKYWLAALEKQPDYAQPYSNLSKWFFDLGQYEKAVEYGRKAITLQPQLVEAYINLSGISKEQGDLKQAQQWLDALLSFAPHHAGALSAKVQICVSQDQPELALQVAQHAVSVSPQSADAYFALGSAYHALNQIDKAREAFDKASTLPGSKAEDGALSSATVCMEAGDKDAAERAFEDVRRRFPKSVRALYSLSEMRKFRGVDDPLIAEMEALLQDARPKDQTALHFALGKAYLDAGDAKNGFAHLHEGNREKRQTLQYDARDAGRHVDSLMQRLSAENIQKAWGKGYVDDTVPTPVFVVGMPRSGTTLMEQILGAHSQATGAGELPFLTKVADQWLENPLFSEDALRHAGKAYMDRIGTLGITTPYFVDKMPANLFYAGLIPLILPRAKVLYMQRDPLDTCLSCYTHLFATGQHFSYQLDELGLFAKDTQRMMDHWQSVLPETHFKVVRYEELVADFQPQVTDILSFLGLEWEAGCMDFHQNTGMVKTASVNQVRKPLYTDSVGRWKAYADYLQPLIEVLS